MQAEAIAAWQHIHLGMREYGMESDDIETVAEYFEALANRKAMAEVTQADREAMARYPSLELCVQFSEDGQHIRKWSREPFDGGECLYVVSAHHFARHRTEAVKPLVEAQDAWAWFSDQHRLELTFYSPMYGDDDDQSKEWRVHEQGGSINDREWTLRGAGETALQAVLNARAALQLGTKGDLS